MRSKSTDIRFITRKTFLKMVTTLSSDYLPQIVRELKLALTRGPQLHILASVVHSILKHTTSDDQKAKLGNLDDCVEDVARIAAEVVFGESAANTQADGFTTSVKEVTGSSNRGQETFMILAKHVSPSKINRVLEPVRAILHEAVSLKMMNLADEVLRRIALGLDSYPLLTSSDILALCHSLITQNAKFLQQAPRLKKQRGKVHNDVAGVAAGVSNHYVSNSFRFVAFGLELFVTSFRKGRFNKQDPDVVSRLEPFVSVISSTLQSSESKVLVLGLRAAVAIVRCPLLSVPSTLPTLVEQTLAILQHAGNTESEVVQTALKTLASFLRDCPSIKLKESDLTFLVEFMTPDIEEPARQETVFLLQAIVLRRFVAPEIYDAMDSVAQVMVTSQSSRAQTLARDVCLLFVTDYPQGKARMKNATEFLARNPAYVCDSSRKSVSELLKRVFETFKPEPLAEYSNLIFMDLVMLLANDDSAKCREAGAEVLTSLFERMGEKEREDMTKLLHGWSFSEARSQLKRVAIQCYGLFVAGRGQKAKRYLNIVLSDTRKVVEEANEAFGRKESEEVEVYTDDREDEAWELAHQALTTITKVLRVLPDLTTQLSKLPWDAV